VTSRPERGWVADLGGLVEPVRSPEDLRAMLSRTAGVADQEFWLTSPGGARLCMLRSAGRALLLFLRGDADGGFSSRAGGEVVGEPMVQFRLANGQRDAYPASWTVSAERAREAIEYFYRTSAMAPFLAWSDA
jgi:hypothetical protein